MDDGFQDDEVGSLSRASNGESSSKNSMLLSNAVVSIEIEDDIENVAEEDVQQAYGVGTNTNCGDATPSAHEITFTSPLLVKAQDGETNIPPALEYVSCMAHLAVFGILGVLTRYSLQKLFGPNVAHVTADRSILYLDLPSNMVGSFLMGWLGVVFKEDISGISEYLAIGLSTGYLGSLTTFSGWNQKMLDLSADSQWLYTALCFLLGMFLAAYSIILGIDTAKGFKWLLQNHKRKEHTSKQNLYCFRINSFRSHMVAMSMMLLILGVLCTLSSVFLKEEFDKGSNSAQLWLGCLVGPLGVWIRWFLARLNGRGLGTAQYLKWVPFGTLIANVSAACAMAALATLKKAVKTETCNTLASGVQLGLLGCLSTVSTLMAEFIAMRESKYPWRAYAYVFFTTAASFGFGTLIYSIPVWEIGFE